MRHLSMLIGMLILFSPLMYGQELRINEVDEFTGSQRMYTERQTVPTDDGMIVAGITWAYLQDQVVMLLEIESRDSWKALGEDQVLWLVGGKRKTTLLTRQDMEISGELGGGTYESYYTILTDPEDWVSADSLRFRVGSVTYELESRHSEALRVLWNNID